MRRVDSRLAVYHTEPERAAEGVVTRCRKDRVLSSEGGVHAEHLVEIDRERRADNREAELDGDLHALVRDVAIKPGRTGRLEPDTESGSPVQLDGRVDLAACDTQFVTDRRLVEVQGHLGPHAQTVVVVSDLHAKAVRTTERIELIVAHRARGHQLAGRERVGRRRQHHVRRCRLSVLARFDRDEVYRRQVESACRAARATRGRRDPAVLGFRQQSRLAGCAVGLESPERYRGR